VGAYHGRLGNDTVAPRQGREANKLHPRDDEATPPTASLLPFRAHQLLQQGRWPTRRAASRHSEADRQGQRRGQACVVCLECLEGGGHAVYL
jgi:hypothetical protein